MGSDRSGSDVVKRTVTEKLDCEAMVAAAGKVDSTRGEVRERRVEVRMTRRRVYLRAAFSAATC